MFLRRKTYVRRWDFNPAHEQFEVKVRRGGAPYLGIDSAKVIYVVEEVAYWRKANQIHKWFVDNCQEGNDNCANYYVSRTQLKELVELCERVLGHRETAAEELPPEEGFFFGGTDLDEYYFQELELTVKQLKPLLEDDRHEIEYEYHSSW